MRKMKMFPKKRHMCMLLVAFGILLAIWYFFLREGREGFDGPIPADPAFATDPSDPMVTPVYPSSQMPTAQMPVAQPAESSTPAPAVSSTSATTPCNYTDLETCQADKSCTWSADKCSVTPGSTTTAPPQDNAAPATPSPESPSIPVPITSSLASIASGIKGLIGF